MDFRRATLLAESRYYNEVLHPRFWSNGKFNPKVRKKLLQIVNDVFGEPEDVVDIDDIQLTGSLSNYNYNKHSDLDVHILLDFSKINKDTDIVKRALDGRRFIWNLRHNIVIHGHEVEIYYQDTKEPHIASGLYSLKDDKWLTEPTYNPPSVDERDVLKKAHGIKDIINRIADKVSGDLTPEQARKWHDHAKSIKEKLGKMRSEGLKNDGEFSIENLAFKELRNDNSIGKLIEVISTTYEKIYSEERVEDEPVEEDINSFADLYNKQQASANKLNDPDTKSKSYMHNAHRGIQRKRQSWVPDTHRTTKADIEHQNVEKSKDDNFLRVISKSEAISTAGKYGIDINNLVKGQVKQLGTSNVKMWFDGQKYYMQGGK